MTTLIRTDFTNQDFRDLVVSLDAELRIRDGEESAFYSQFNQIDNIQHVVVAYVNGSPSGCGAFKPFDETTVEIKRMFVTPELRGQRIAEQVLSELESWAVEIGMTSCVLETGFKQPEAIRLYQRSGYQTIPNYGQYIGVENSVCMQKLITEQTSK